MHPASTNLTAECRSDLVGGMPTSGVDSRVTQLFPAKGSMQGGQSFVSDPDVPPILKEAGHKGKPQAARLARSIDA
jgi:hypothetical protein